MAYWITQFGTAALPTRGEDQDISPGPVRSSLVMLPGGEVYDTRGSGGATQAGQVLTVSGKLLAANGAALKTAYDLLRAFKGDYAKLYRTPDGGSANSEWVYARCLGVPTRRSVESRLWLPVSLIFELQESYWHGADGSDSVTLTTTTVSAEITNAGNAEVRDIIITVTATGAAITQIDIKNLEVGYLSHIRYTNTIAIGQSLVINCGAKSVLNNSVEDFDGFHVITATHKVTGWLVLKPSADSTIEITRAGGGNANTCAFSFDHAWE